MSTPGFVTADTEIDRRARAVAAVGDALAQAADAAVVASGPEAFGVLCGFLPTMLDRASQHTRDALGRAAATCGTTVGDLRAADAAFTATDDAGAAGFGR